jgi:uncharacterized SAM-binding protein YcdF (DUF218 family)
MAKGTPLKNRRLPSTSKALWRGLRWTIVIFCVLAFVWAVGFVWFAATLPGKVADRTTKTGAIVVLTGGGGRLREGIRLLKANLAPRLFLSGVNRKVKKADVLRAAGTATPRSIADRIELGYQAAHTRGNAFETGLWASKLRMKSLRLVTSNYHMRRSLLELRRVLPTLLIVPHPVFPRQVRRGRWWRNWTGIETVFLEYNKYLAALIRVNLALDARTSAAGSKNQ